MDITPKEPSMRKAAKRAPGSPMTLVICVRVLMRSARDMPSRLESASPVK